MPSGVFAAVEPGAPVAPLLERLRPAVEAERAHHDAASGTVQAELRTSRAPSGELAVRRFYWSTHRADPSSAWGFSARTLFTEGDGTPLRIHEFPSDPELSWLDQEPGPLRLAGRSENIDVLRYMPLRRLTFRLHDGPGLPPRVIGKVKRPSGLNRAATAVLAVHLARGRRRSDAPKVPGLLRLEPPRHVLYLEELPGRPLPAALPDLDLRDAMQQVGTLHRALQELDVRGLPLRRTTSDWLEDAEAAASQVGRFVPSAARLAAEVHAALVRDAEPDARLLYCQSEFTPVEILHHSSGWSVVDLDDSCYADPLSEVASMYAAIPHELRVAPEQAETAREAYLEAYAARAGEPLDRARLRWFLVLLELSELGKRLMKGRVAPGETHAVLERLARPQDVGPD